MRKNVLLPGAALLAGIVGFALRKWELATAFEPDTGLPIAGVPATLVLIAWSALVAAVLIFLTRRGGESRSFDETFSADGSPLYLTAFVVSAFLLLASAGVEVVTYPVVIQNILPVEEGGSRLALLLPGLRIGLCVLGFACVLVVGQNLYRSRGRGRENLALLGLCLLFCVWLISDYQGRAADPVILDYIYEVFAIITGLLGIYFITGYSFQTGKPWRTAAMCLLGAYFSLVTLADHHSLADIFRYAFTVLFLISHAVLLLREHPAGETPAETEVSHHA